MNTEIWNELLKAAGDDYELCNWDRENMITNSAVFHLIVRGRYRAAIECWMK